MIIQVTRQDRSRIQGLGAWNGTFHFHLVLALSVLLAIPSVLFAQEDPSDSSDPSKGIVVWTLQAKTGVSQEDVESLTGLLTTQVEKSVGCRVISEADIETILRGEAKRQNCDGAGTTCMAEIGNALGVPEMVAGDLGRVGRIWILNIRRINTRQIQVIKRVSKQVEGDITDLVRALPGAVEELFQSDVTGGMADGGAVIEPDGQDEQDRTNQQTFSFPMTAQEKWGWGTLGAGLGMIAIGGLSTGMWIKTAGDFNDGDVSAEKSSDAWYGATIAGYTIGGALVTTGIILLLLDPEDKDDSPGTGLTFGVGPQRGGMNVMIQGRW